MTSHYLTQIMLTPKVIKQQKITDTYSLHRLVYDQFERDLFKEGEDRSMPIWAISNASETQKVFILSKALPRVVHEVVGKNRRTIMMPEEFLKQKEYSFKVTLNPVRRQKDKVFPIKESEQIAIWFCELAKRNGFSVNKDKLCISNVYADILKKSNMTVTLNKADISGVLVVENDKLFTDAVLNGIGRSKAFGCGLLQVIPSNH